MLDLRTASTWYPHSDPIHGFDHVLRVLRLAEHLALQEGADVEIVRAAVLLHDAHDPRQAISNVQAMRDHHHLNSADFARQVLQAEEWPEVRIAAVEHCIRAHRFRDNSEPPQTLEARVLFDADKLDAIGAIGVARAIAFAAQNGQPPYARPSEHFLRTGECEVGESHSAYHEYLFKLNKLSNRMYTRTARQIADQRHWYMQGFFERLAAEASW
jgi:uncharacterized protein